MQKQKINDCLTELVETGPSGFAHCGRESGQIGVTVQKVKDSLTDRQAAPNGLLDVLIGCKLAKCGRIAEKMYYFAKNRAKVDQ